MHCAVNAGQSVRKSDIAKACNTSENHMAQVINQLSRLGVVVTTRGRQGGVKIGMAPEDISLGMVFREMEAGVPFAECMAGDRNTCPLSETCKMRDVLCGALSDFYAHLDSVMLSDLIDDNTPLQKVLLMQ